MSIIYFDQDYIQNKAPEEVSDNNPEDMALIAEEYAQSIMQHLGIADNYRDRKLIENGVIKLLS